MDMIAHLKATAAAMTALEVGSPEALTACRQRLREAQAAAQRIVGTYAPSERSLEWAEQERTYRPDDDVEGEPV